jgi:hypothetical protein
MGSAVLEKGLIFFISSADGRKRLETWLSALHSPRLKKQLAIGFYKPSSPVFSLLPLPPGA